MRVGFFCQTPGEHLDMASHLVRSVRESMPGVEVFHLTNGGCPAADGVDGVIRLSGDMPMAIRRVAIHSMLAGDWLFVDTDCVIRKDVRHVFDDEFMVALTDRKGSIWERSEYGKLMPYNMGVTFSRSPGFWARVLEGMNSVGDDLKQWCGDQLVVCKIAALNVPGIKVLPGRVYNYTPEKRGDSLDHAAIVHYKGERKKWLTG